MNFSDYDYDLPVELIAQHPSENRDESRLLVLPEETDAVVHKKFYDLPDFLEEGDLLVINNTRVFPARLIGVREKTGGEVEIFLLRPCGDCLWEALSRPSRRLQKGTFIVFGDNILRAEIVEKGIEGHVKVRLSSHNSNIDKAIDKAGITPLPPYIKRTPSESDRLRYQTVYANEQGAVAAPTAGLHFTEALLDKLAACGIQRAVVTLHVGIGTFRPLSEKDAEGDRLHSEYCRIPESTVRAIAECRARSGRIISVGTTTARALETASESGAVTPYEGWTDIFIKPPYRYKTVDVLLTNFHLPQSSLLLMVSAFAGRERIFYAYREAICRRYRFYSYGDAMLIFGGKQ
ncbi:tRNA preQ1(34) S-adenosylmethionine ribosyltransferase-isomerase QueA [Candidatus Omnitrophota bacterium]